ncbi:MAG: phospholipid carrier-dependent glycosyltransferase [Lentisphaerae bacterium]|nr:phospholipid carrier-dependent glycosyltransferase [Lentisphaerota bacterium]
MSRLFVLNKIGETTNKPKWHLPFQYVILLLIVMLGFWVRFWGISWGLPDRPDIHPDEHDYVIKHALSINRHHLDPDFLNYPSFLCYSVAALHKVLKYSDPDRPDWKANESGRIIVAVFGTLSILVIFLIARNLNGKVHSALLSAAFMALLPLHVWESHVAVTDVFMTFWILLTLLFSLKLLKQPTIQMAILTGICLGLATGAKYTAAITSIAIILTIALTKTDWLNKIKLLVIAGSTSLFACFLVTPFSFIRFTDTLKALAYEHAHTHGHHLGFSVPANGFQYHRFVYQLFAAWPFSFGVPLYLATLFGCIWFCFRPSRSRWVIIAFTTTYILLVCSMTFTPLRYYIPILSIGTLIAGLWLCKEISTSNKNMRRTTARLFTLFVLGYTAIFTFSTTSRFPNDTRVTASKWIQKRIDEGWKIHCFGWRRYLCFTDMYPGQIYEHHEKSLKHIYTMEADDLIQISSLHFLRWERHGNEGFIHAYDTLRNNSADFELMARFDNSFLNKKFYTALDPMFACYFISPTLEFYRRRQPQQIHSQVAQSEQLHALIASLPHTQVHLNSLCNTPLLFDLNDSFVSQEDITNELEKIGDEERIRFYDIYKHFGVRHQSVLK